YRKVVNGKQTSEVVYLSAMEESIYSIAQANAEVNTKGELQNEFVNARVAGEATMIPREDIQYMDVSPKQVVSVAAALIPYLENDDANRALMGSNMQRQAVPLVKSEAPFVGTGMEAVVARDSRAAIVARRAGVVEQVDALRIVVRATDEIEGARSGVDIYRLAKFRRSNQNSCINQR
ncbi:MAG: DNA-directed RNA polymerase subunit beta, partial [Dehalococcoidia bacterium]|nr:DNA-directed RNA polymerase subunit beta [Dehalococcoidia bacterium]